MTHQTVWGWPIVAEEFFFGIAAGAFIVAALLDIVGKRTEHRSILRLTFIVSAIAAIIGQLFLVLELGRPDRASPAFIGGKGAVGGAFHNYLVLGTSVMSSTAVLLVVFTAISVIVGAAWLILPGKLVPARRAVEVLGIIFGVPAGLQAGLLLQAATQRPFWATAVFPYLYLITAILAGIGVLGLLMVARNITDVSSLLIYSLLLIIIQAGALAAHLTLVSAPREVLELLTNAAIAPTFYVGVLALGMLVPGGYAAKVVKTGFTASKGGAALAFILLIIGSLALRIAFLFAGQTV